MRVIAFTLFVCSALFAQLTLEEIRKAPRSIAKDYYIWQLLDKDDITSDEAEELLGEASRVNGKLFLKFAQKIDNEGLKFTADCMQRKASDYLQKSNDCIEIGLGASKATKLDKEDLKKLSLKIQKDYPKKAKVYDIIASDDPFSALLLSENETFFSTFNNIGSKYREENFNKPIPQKKIKELEIDKKFGSTVKIIVMDANLTNLQLSLFDVNPEALDHKATFFLAINAIKHDKLKAANKYLVEAEKKAYFRFDKDKVLFWQYQISKDEKYLEELSNSFDINIYSQFADEKLGIIKNNIISKLDFEKRDDFIKIDDIFEWVKYLDNQKNISKEETKELASKLYSPSQEPYAAFMMERIGEYEKHYFLMPYLDVPAMQKASSDRIALILALSRQESRFIPLSISTSYALGMMQFMPFVANGIADGRYKSFDLEQMFDPKWAYKFANIHLDYLQKHLNNPLFVAYAYNGGIGYTRRLLKNGLFQKGKYEPYLSMEFVNYDETRRYGKKVLSNYIVYKSLVDEPTTLQKELEKVSN